MKLAAASRRRYPGTSCSSKTGAAAQIGGEMFARWTCVLAAVISGAGVFHSSFSVWLRQRLFHGRRAKSFVRDIKTFAVCSNKSSICYLFGPSSPACCPAASPTAASPAPTWSPAAAARAAQVSEVDVQLGCDVVGWFAEVVVSGLVPGLEVRGVS